jgi:diguanylate cyclase (GGDEF)-like protein
MHVDLPTLYYLVVGTLLASAALTLWEAQINSARRRPLRLLTIGYTTLAVGCTIATFRDHLFGGVGAASANLVIVAGYLLVWNGLACFVGRRHLIASLALWLLMLAAWLLAGRQAQTAMWMYVSAVPIALICALAMGDALSIDPDRELRARYIVAAVMAVHASTYALRCSLLPWWVSRHGSDGLLLASWLTMYEGVLFSVVLPMAVLRLVREEAHGELLRDSRTDYLTQLGNRRWFFEESERLMRAKHARGPLSLLAFDLDHFKQINDEYGHDTGDSVLQAFADTARTVLGAPVVLARMGGEEFVALLPGRHGEEARQVGEALVRQFAEAAAAGVCGMPLAATVSVGLAQLDQDASSLACLLAASDRALYRAKAQGGNRLELA